MNHAIEMRIISIFRTVIADKSESIQLFCR